MGTVNKKQDMDMAMVIGTTIVNCYKTYRSESPGDPEALSWGDTEFSSPSPSTIT